MNVHYCPVCGRGFWARGNLGDEEKLPKHTVDKQGCSGQREPAVVVKPPPSGDRPPPIPSL